MLDKHQFRRYDDVEIPYTLNSVTMSGHVKYERSRSPGEMEGESASHDDHRVMHGTLPWLFIP